MAAPADFHLKAHDLLPSIQASLTNGGAAVDLTGATVKFIMRAADANFSPSAGTAKINTAAVLVPPATSGVVRYDWVTGDTDSPGNYVAEWQVTFTGSKTETFPTLTYHTIAIMADLDGGI